MQSTTELQPVRTQFSLCDPSYAAVADALCDVPHDLKGVSDTPSLSGSLGQIAGKISFALMEAHSFGTAESPDAGAAAVLDTGRAILFEGQDGALRFGVDVSAGNAQFDVLPEATTVTDRCIAIDPEPSGRRDLRLHDVWVSMSELTNLCNQVGAPVDTLALSLGRCGNDISLGVWVSEADAPDEYLSIADLKAAFVQ